MKKNLYYCTAFLVAVALGVCFTSCDENPDEQKKPFLVDPDNNKEPEDPKSPEKPDDTNDGGYDYNGIH